MQHFFAQEIEANHRRRELERQIQARAMADIAGSGRGQVSEPLWRRWSNTGWRSFAPPRFALAFMPPAPLALAKRD